MSDVNQIDPNQMCDVCCGDPTSVRDCICGGSGTIQGTAHGLRKELLRTQNRYAEFRMLIRSELSPWWLSNPAVDDYEIIRAVKRLMTSRDTLSKAIDDAVDRAAEITKEHDEKIEIIREKHKRWDSMTPGAVRGYCNKDGCPDSFHSGGNYGSEVCYNPNHHAQTGNFTDDPRPCGEIDLDGNPVDGSESSPPDQG